MATKATSPLSASQQQAIYALALSAYGSLSGITQRLKGDDAKALGMTKASLGQLVFEMSQKRSQHVANQQLPLAAAVSRLKSSLHERSNQRLTQRLRADFAYRQPETKWIEIANSVKAVVQVGHRSELYVRVDVKYHPKHNWKANESAHVLFLNPLDDFTMVGGLVTVFRKADRNEPAIPCRWYEQSRGFEVREVAGYLVGDYHVEAESAPAALVLAKRRTQQASKARQAQADLAAGKDSAMLTAKGVHTAFGFCVAGIRSFCAANGLDPEAAHTLREVRAAVVKNRELNCRAYASYLRQLGITLNCA